MVISLQEKTQGVREKGKNRLAALEDEGKNLVEKNHGCGGGGGGLDVPGVLKKEHGSKTNNQTRKEGGKTQVQGKHRT